MVVSRLTQRPGGAFDSRELAFLCALIHPMTTEGEFTCRVVALSASRDKPAAAQAPDSVVAEVMVRVTAASSTLQVAIDLADTATLPTSVELAPSGYLLFHFSDEAGRFAVTLSHASEEGVEIVDYSSTELQPGDIFAVILLEEGTFDLANLANGTSAVLNVVVPPIKSQLENVYELAAEAGGFTPAALDVDLGGTLSITVQVAKSVLVSAAPVRQAPGPDRVVR